jgi:DnaJ-domain-containing protein 1
MSRLGDLLRSYLLDDNFDNDFGSETARVQGDPDLDDAWAELDELLGGASSAWTGKPRDWEDPYRSGAREDWGNFHQKTENRSGPPERLRADFAELGVAFGADEKTCKAAYKKLLKTHHPDRHGGHEDDTRKATATSARINAAYENICQWRSTGV